mmetsp:Transcript_58089/g.136434  ORF Transcript_58089/g.136434 Transcript_58089/m.136434 type:complete len:550 (+) Transcript_58089:198-1847(+)
MLVWVCRDLVVAECAFAVSRQRNHLPLLRVRCRKRVRHRRHPLFEAGVVVLEEAFRALLLSLGRVSPVLLILLHGGQELLVLVPLSRLFVLELAFGALLELFELLLLHLRRARRQKLLLDLDLLYLFLELLLLLQPRASLLLDLLLELRLGLLSNLEAHRLVVLLLLNLAPPLVLGVQLPDLPHALYSGEALEHVILFQLLLLHDLAPLLFFLLPRRRLNHLEPLEELRHRHGLQHMIRLLRHRRRVKVRVAVDGDRLHGSDLPHNIHARRLLLGFALPPVLLELLRLVAQLHARHHLLGHNRLHRGLHVLFALLHVLHQLLLGEQRLLPLRLAELLDRRDFIPHLRCEALVVHLVLDLRLPRVLVRQQHLHPPALDLLEAGALVAVAHPRLPLVELRVVAQLALVLVDDGGLLALLFLEQGSLSQHRGRIQPHRRALGSFQRSLGVRGLRRQVARRLLQLLLRLLHQVVAELVGAHDLLLRELRGLELRCPRLGVHLHRLLLRFLSRLLDFFQGAIAVRVLQALGDGLLIGVFQLNRKRLWYHSGPRA